MSDLGIFHISKKLMTPTFQWHKSCNVLSSGDETSGFEIRAGGVISLLAVRFPMKILGNSRMLLMNRDNHNQLLGNLVIFEKLPTF